MEKSNQNDSFWRRAVAGLVIGVGCILPGVSGGVIAVSFGLYRPMLDAVASFLKGPKRNFAFLLPIALGGVLGVLLGALLLGYVMKRYQTPILFLFIGMILGGVPSLLAQANEGGFRIKNLWALLGGIVAALSLLLLESAGVRNASVTDVLTPLQALAAGAIIAFGSIVPGISMSFLLIYLGWYQSLLNTIGRLELLPLLLLALGCVLCALALIRIVKWVFDHYHGYAFYAVLGFLLVSVGLVFPGFESGWRILTDVLLCLLGLTLGFVFGKGEEKQGS